MSHLPFHLHRRGRTLVLTGTLDGSAATRKTCDRVLSEAKQRVRSLTVDARRAAVIPGGLTIWIEAAMEHLSRVSVHYLDSQLADVLRFDRRYRHTKTRFDRSELDPDRAHGRTRKSTRSAA